MCDIDKPFLAQSNDTDTTSNKIVLLSKKDISAMSFKLNEQNIGRYR